MLLWLRCNKKKPITGRTLRPLRFLVEEGKRFDM